MSVTPNSTRRLQSKQGGSMEDKHLSSAKEKILLKGSNIRFAAEQTFSHSASKPNSLKPLQSLSRYFEGVLSLTMRHIFSILEVEND